MHIKNEFSLQTSMSVKPTMEAVNKCAITPLVASSVAVRWVTNLIAVDLTAVVC